MKFEIIPAILTKQKKEFMRLLEDASLFSQTVQIDIMDGLFVDNQTPKSLNNGHWWSEYLINHPDQKLPDIELHLMVIDPWSVIREWQEYAELKRVIWHVEVPIDHAALNETAHDLRIQTGLAMNPDTELKEIIPFINPKTNSNPEFVDQILIMGVDPGFSGQSFKSEVLKKISKLRSKFPKLNLGVDGGVSSANIKQIKQAGANRFNAAGAIFKAADPQTAYKQLKKAVA